MVFCKMCDREVPPSRPGRCLLGHPLDVEITKRPAALPSGRRLGRAVGAGALILIVLVVALKAGTKALEDQKARVAKPPAVSAAGAAASAFTPSQRKAFDAETIVALRVALTAELTFYVDTGAFASDVGADLRALRAIEGLISWGSRDAQRHGVDVVVPASHAVAEDILVLRSTSMTGTTYCIATVKPSSPAKLWYAKGAPTGKCPEAGETMRGWSQRPWQA